MLSAAVRCNPRLVGLTYPRDVWWMRAYLHIWNVGHAVVGSRARWFMYRHAQVNRLMAELGFANAHEGGTREWRVVLYRRA